MPDPTILRRISESIESGTPVDWEKEIASHPDLAAELRRLRLVESERRAGDAPEPLTETVDLEDAAGLSEWGPLRILEKIGAGGFGEVFRARDRNLDRDVALKLRHPARAGDPESEERFLDEARTLARVRHPNVLTVHGAGRHQGRVGLWTDLVRGKTLEDLLKRQGTFGAEEAALIGIDLCRALAAVHGAGLVHRDVKTGNVMREDGGRIVLLDFSAVSEREGERETSLAGTPVFMAPETLRGDPSDTRSDIYSLGVVLYRLVSGRFPVEAANLTELLERRRRGESVPLRDVRPDLPATFVQAVERALDADPARRYASAGEMERALAVALGTRDGAGTTGGATPAPDPAPAPPSSRRRLWAALIGVGLIAAAAALWFAAGSGAPYEVEATLYRVTDDVPHRLRSGDSLSLGDRLFLELEGTKAMHVYVLNEDDRGHSLLLFPRKGLDAENPLRATRLHRLPGSVDGNEVYWSVDSTAGRETFLVVASREPVPLLEERVRAEAEAPETRGIGGLSAADPETDPRFSIGGVHRRLATETAARSGVWYWEVDLVNLGETADEPPSGDRP
jgi:tRNA A-37 threonylcarbamoyl transferase component Bud32